MRIKPIVFALAGIAVVAAAAAAGVVGWMVFQPGPYAFAEGTPVELSAYLGPSPTGVATNLAHADAATNCPSGI